ncbi:MAG: hypothetical protein NVS3B26_08490 [Mycobacteriales bacterium]
MLTVGEYVDAAVAALARQDGAVSSSDRIIRPAAVIPERLARLVLAWLKDNDVARGGLWASDVASIQRFSGPFDGIGGMRGSSRLLGSLHITWDKYEVTIYRVHVTDEGAASGLSVEALCDEVLAPAGLTLASCPRAHLAPAPLPDPFRRP